MQEAIIDSFAGGGGASTGIFMALGRHPDVAINHDKDAIRMHAANHPDTVHLNENIYQVDPDDLRRKYGAIGLLWASPDCKHFSKAKGGKPVSKNIRGLAWTVCNFAERAKPRVIALENVEEFEDWGPLTEEDKPCQVRRGETFKAWVLKLKRAGYQVQWRVLRASDFGAPTIRRRLFVIARRDGEPIVWPEPTHGAPDDPEVIAGRKLPWRTAADIIDWSLPMPSIFMTKEQAQAYFEETGIRVVRPLAENTMARIARGVDRYVLKSANPFIISVAHGYSGGRREYPLGDPIGTVTGAGIQHALISPVISHAQQGGANRDADAPMHTITASLKDQNQIIAPALMKFRADSAGAPVEAPCPTVTANSYIKRPGGASPLGVCAAFLAQHNAGPNMESAAGRDARVPLSTVTTTGSQQAVAGVHMINMKGSKRSARGADEPVSTITANAVHAGLVAAFIGKYYGTGDGQAGDEPTHTVTTKDRFGLVTIQLEGEPYVIVDIGMRMLTPRELFSAQGFPADYIIDQDATGRPFTKSTQTRCAGNSVCPPLAAALVKANFQPREIQPETRFEEGPLFAVAAE